MNAPDANTCCTCRYAESAVKVLRNSEAGVALPPNVSHRYMVVEGRHKVDTLRRAIYAIDAQRVLVFMNFQQRLKVGLA